MKWVSWRACALSVVAVASVMALQACGGGGGSNSPTPVANPTGEVTVKQTAYDPALAPQSMSGGLYVTDENGLLESFGAIDVQLPDGATSQAPTLAKPATIRIPVRTRSAATPDEKVKLYRFATDAQVWVLESEATRTGNAETGYHYEGTVSHVGTWSAGKPITDTVTVSGCVVDKDNKVPTTTVKVYTDGTDYSGLAWGAVGSDGKFSVRMKRGASALLVVKDAASEATVVNTLTNVGANKDQGACLKLPEVTDQLTFLGLMTSLDKVITLALAPSATVNVSTGSPQQLSPAASVCTKGTLGQYTLDGAAATAGLPIGATSTHQLNVGFKGCAPQVAGLGALTGITSAPVFTGESAAQFSYTLPLAGGFQLTATTQLSSLLDFSTNLSASGQFDASVSSDAAGTSVVAVVTPSAGATLTNLITGRTLSFVSGNVQVSSTGLRYNDFTFKLNGNTYVAKGAFNRDTPAEDAELTLSRYVGAQLVQVGVINTKSIGGVVDPF